MEAMDIKVDLAGLFHVDVEIYLPANKYKYSPT